VAATRETIEVWGDWTELETAPRIGLLHAVTARGKQVFSFEYDDVWIAGSYDVDDHLRNHGFLFEDDGWSLAPAYDMNPNADGDGLT
jgi:serine/threonine-protein kinase HipA